MAWNQNMAWESLENEALELFRQLLRIDTCNPPGHERPAAELLARYLGEAGLRPRILEKEPGRSNLVVRIEGRGTAPSLLLDSHLDTVPATPEGWRASPLGGELRDGFVWGRGALDMKCMTAMSAVVMKLYAQRGQQPGATLVMTATADEEAGGQAGAEWLVTAHPDLIRCDYALGEVGGISITLAGRRVFPVQVAERGLCWAKIVLTGESGHGSIASPKTLPVAAGQLANRLSHLRLPIQVHPAAASFLNGIAPLFGTLPSFALKRLAKGGPDASLWLALMGRRAQQIRPMVSSTLRVTGIHSGHKVNVVPAEAEIVLDGRVLPGTSPQRLLDLVERVLPATASLQPLLLAHGTAVAVDNPMLRTIKRVLNKMDPHSLVVPALSPGHTNGSAYASLGMKYLGFTPISMPPTVNFADLFHATNERCPIDGFRWGVRTLAQVVESFMDENRS